MIKLSKKFTLWYVDVTLSFIFFLMVGVFADIMIMVQICAIVSTSMLMVALGYILRLLFNDMDD